MKCLLFRKKHVSGFSSPLRNFIIVKLTRWCHIHCNVTFVCFNLHLAESSLSTRIDQGNKLGDCGIF